MAIVAGPFATEKIGARTCRWQEDQAPFLVNGYRGPHVCGSGWCDIGLPIHGNWPCGARWNRIERPPGRARDDVIGVKSPARRAYTLIIVNRGPNDYHVPRHYWCRGDLHFTGTEHLRERNYGDCSVFAETLTWPACLRVECYQASIIGREEYSRCANVESLTGAAPVGDPSANEAVRILNFGIDLGIETPKLLSRSRIQRADFVERGAEI